MTREDNQERKTRRWNEFDQQQAHLTNDFGGMADKRTICISTTCSDGNHSNPKNEPHSPSGATNQYQQSNKPTFATG
jgi:hypothetical protein